jgi:DNA-binding LytR/AlgR family response regulator
MKNAAPQKSVTAPAKILSLDTNRVLQKVTHQYPNFIGSPYPQGRLAIPGLGRIDMIEVADILYVKAESMSGFLKGRGAMADLQVSASLIAYGFIRVHQSFLVHPSIIKSYHSKVGTIVLNSGDELPVSRPNRKAVSLQLLNISCI